MEASEEEAHFFGHYQFYPRRQLLLRGRDPVRIGVRALDLLQILVRNKGEVVSKAELLRFAWPNVFIDESNLKVNIAALRRALSPGADELPFIATVPGRGYRFVAPVRADHAGPPAREVTKRAAQQSLPVLWTFVGRDDDLEQVTRILHEKQLVTIVGPAGVGKTTLAVAAARRLALDFEGCCYFVDLGGINDPQLVGAAIASVLGLSGGLVDLLAGIIQALRGSSSLLILDNCEHVLAAVTAVADHIHAAAPDIGIIATSREPLKLLSETIHRLQPLQCPPSETVITAAQALEFPAVELFVARARDAAGYELDDRDAPVVADICRRLDGLPLAIELAAPRLRTGDAAALLDVLARSLEALSWGARAAPMRHQALHATLDWSYRLLSDGEATLFQLLSLFAGEFTRDDVLGLVTPFGRAADEVVADLESLAAKSLVAVAEGGVRHRLLDTTRRYAAERLWSDGDALRAHQAYVAYLLQLFEQAEHEWEWWTREDWVASYGNRANDVRKALDWAFGANGEVAIGVRLTVAAIPLWDELSSLDESRRRVRTALDAAQSDGLDPLLQLKLYAAHARGLSFADRLEPDAEAVCRDGIRLADRVGDADYQIRSVWALAVLQSFAGRHRDALATLDRFDEIARRSNDHSAAPAGGRFRIMTEFYLGDLVGPHQALRQLAKQHDKPGPRARISRFQVDPLIAIRVSLGFVAWVRGDIKEAVTMAEAAVDCATVIEHPVSQSNALALASIPVAILTGDLDRAESRLSLLVENLNKKALGSWTPISDFFGAVIRHRRGHSDAFNEMRAAAAAIVASGFLLRSPMYLGMLAEAALERGQVDLARSAIMTAQSHSAERGEAWGRVELLRILGLVEQASGAIDQAEQILRRCVEQAERTGALSFQLRAALSLAELWTAQRRMPEAVALLEPVYRQFWTQPATDDFDKATALLDRIQHGDRGRKLNGSRGLMDPTSPRRS